MGNKMFRTLARMISDFVYFARHENLGRLFILILLLIIISTIGLYLFEPDITIFNAIWWSIVTLTTVGYGDITPTTTGGRIIGVFIMFLGIGLLGTFTATVASFFVEKKMKEEKGMKSFDFEDHVILCGWNFRAREILEEFRNDPRMATKPVILIASIDSKPVDDDRLYFIQGEVTEDTLTRANLSHASSVVILGDDTLDETSRDAKVVLSVLTVESLNPNVYTVVELSTEENIKHCQRAHADEIIVGSEFSARLLARATMDHGISKVISELLSARLGNDLYKIPATSEMIGQTFLDAMTRLKREKNSIALGIHHADGTVVTNPPSDMKIQEGDEIIVITLKHGSAGASGA